MDPNPNEATDSHFASTQFTFTNTTEVNTNTSLEASPTKQNLDTIIYSRPIVTNLNGTTLTDSNFTLLDD